MPRRGWRIGILAAALGARAAHGEDDAARARRYEETCELARVSDRARTTSFRCVGCHDGSTGAGSVFVMGRGRPPGQSMSHPVEIDYAEAHGRDARHFVPERALPPEVPLVQGKVACTSCHDPASPLDKHVIDPVKLCTSCHSM